MALTASVACTVPFHDIDIMYIVWHGHYLKYFELARTALMKSLSLDWPDLKAMGIAMPVVDVRAQYRRPLKYAAVFSVEARIEEFRYPELKIDYVLRQEGSRATSVLGSTRQVYMDITTGESLFAVPEDVLQRFIRAEEEAP